jgi:hypothetical protein
VDGYIVDWDMFVWASIICDGERINESEFPKEGEK